MAAKYGVDNPVPPWKTSLDGICDALDQSSCGAGIPSVDRRNEGDALSAAVYSLPYPKTGWLRWHTRWYGAGSSTRPSWRNDWPLCGETGWGSLTVALVEVATPDGSG